jgi:hypothetical protein
LQSDQRRFANGIFKRWVVHFFDLQNQVYGQIQNII